MAGWDAHVMDVKGAFLNGEFHDGEEVYMKVSQGFKKYYEDDMVLKLNKTINGLKQAAMCFWKELLEAMNDMEHKKSKADPCMYYSWNSSENLAIWIIWIDDNLCIGNRKVVKREVQMLSDRFEVDDVGTLEEYVGCKIDIDQEKQTLKFMQPVLLQSFADEFELPKRKPTTPLVPGTVLTKADATASLPSKRQSKYQSGVGKLLHMMRWSRPEIYNATRELAKHMTCANEGHYQAMLRVMAYCVHTPERGLLLASVFVWDGKKGHKFKVWGKSDSDYAKCPETRHSVTGCCVFLNDSPVMFKSAMERTVSLSTTEAESAAAVTCAHDMLYVMKVLESVGLTVEKPMVS